MTRDERVLAYLHGILRGSQDDRNRAAADAAYVAKHGPVTSIALRVGDKVMVYRMKPSKSKKARKQ